MSVPLAIAKAAQAATRPARAVSNEAAVTTGVEAALAEEFSAAADEIDDGGGPESRLPDNYSRQVDPIYLAARSGRSYGREADHCLAHQAVGMTELKLLSGPPGRGRAVAGLAGPAPVVTAGRCACCGGATWQHQARDICGRCGHSTQHEELEVRLVSHPI